MFKFVLLLAFFASTLEARPQAGCSTLTETSHGIATTRTYTQTPRDVTESTTVYTTITSASEATETSTEIDEITPSTTILTVTTTSSVCTSTATTTITEPATTTAYTGGPSRKHRRQDCTVTSTVSTLDGTVYSYTTLPTHTVTSVQTITSYEGGTPSTTTTLTTTITSTNTRTLSYIVATGTSTIPTVCGPTVTSNATVVTTTQAAKCAPTSLISSGQGYGLGRVDESPVYPHGVFATTTADASTCCQLCVDTQSCAASSFRVADKSCHLIFTVNVQDSNNVPECGGGALYAFYHYGPLAPLSPADTRYIVQTGCGGISVFNDFPDDGS